MTRNKIKQYLTYFVKYSRLVSTRSTLEPKRILKVTYELRFWRRPSPKPLDAKLKKFEHGIKGIHFNL